MTSDAIFLLDENGALRRMDEGPYEKEDVLQDLLAQHHDLLAGHQIDRDNPRRWLLVAREMGIAHEQGAPARWSVDHLFIDQDAVPTIVEVKRASDTRIRREVVGQMLDYAANGVVTWDIASLQARWVEGLPDSEKTPELQLAEFLGDDGVRPDKFWETVEDNLRNGKVRMVFVADEIPTELRRIVEFLAIQMNPARVVAIEVKNYQNANSSARTLVPRVIGAPEIAKAAKAAKPMPSYAQALEAASQDVRDVAEHLATWAAANKYESRTTASSYVVEAPRGNRIVRLYPAWEYVELPLTPLRDAGLEVEAAAIFEELRELVGKELAPKYPGIPCDVLAKRWGEFEARILPHYVAARQHAFTTKGARGSYVG